MTFTKQLSLVLVTTALVFGAFFIATTASAVTKVPVSIIRANESGAHVTELQKALAEAGYYTAPVSGLYDYRTTNAVTAMQRATGLAVDGVAGPNTITRLNTLTSASSPAATTTSNVAVAAKKPAATYSGSSNTHRHLINQRIVMGEILANGSNSRPWGIAACNSNEVVLGGGYNIEVNSDFDVLASYPNTDSSWKVIIDPGIGGDALADLASDQGVSTATAMNTFLQNGGSKVYAVCAEEEDSSGGSSSHF